jgi:SlyX protein
MHAPADAHPDDRVQQRLTELEIKASYAEDTLDRLNDVIVRQQAQIDALVRELALLHQQAPAADAPAFRSLRDDLPPHY